MNKKRVLYIVVAMALLVSLVLCGCSPADQSLLDPKKPVTLTLWHYYVSENQQSLEEAVSQFNQGPGIENGVVVEAVAMGSIADLEAAVTDSAAGAINARPMPDIFSSYPDKAMEIDEMGLLCDMNEYFTDEEKQQYVDSFLADGLFEEGRFLLVPIVKSTELMYINDTAWQDFCAAEGYSNSNIATFEGIYETAKAYYEWSGGKALMGFDSVANFIIIGNKQLGVDVIDGKNRQAVLNGDVLYKIFELYYNGMSMGYFNEAGKFRSDDIKAGDLISYVGSSSSAAYFPTWIEQDSAQADIDLLALQYPTFAEGSPYAIQQGAGMCVAKSTPEKQEAASLFLKWFTSKEQNINFAMTTGYLPVEKQAYTDDQFDEMLQTLRTGNKEMNNVADVYEIALEQIVTAETYAAKSFPGSYDMRSTLQSTLIDMGIAGEEQVTQLRYDGMDDEAILKALDTPARFEEWLAAIRTRLDELDIPYTE